MWKIILSVILTSMLMQQLVQVHEDKRRHHRITRVIIHQYSLIPRNFLFAKYSRKFAFNLPESYATGV